MSYPIPHSPFRAGITLLEVLIAVGVLTVGLLALASLIPIGKYQLAEAAKMDRGSALGRAAFRTLQVGQWLRPEMWLYAPASGSLGSPVVVGSRFMPFVSGVGTTQPPMVPLVLDPLMIGVNNPSSNSSANAYVSGANASGQQLAQTFPYGAGTSTQSGPEGSAPIIPRITLRNVPGPYMGGNSLTPLNVGGADRLFRGTDDLVYNNGSYVQTSGGFVSVTTTGAESQTGFVALSTYPTIQYIGTTAYNANAISMSQGDYSWMVTIQPDVSQIFGVQGQSGTFYDSNAATARQFLASVVVFQKRPLIPLANSANIPGTVNVMQTVDPNARGERMVWVDFISRGTVRLRTSNTTLIQNGDDAAKFLSVRANEWFVVSGLRQNANNQAPNPYVSSTSGWPEVSLHWYQVVTVSTPQNWSGQWYVDAVVIGDDWSQNGATGKQFWLYTDQNSFGYSDYQNPPTGIGTLMTGAIGVFTKSITIDNSSLWTDR